MRSRSFHARQKIRFAPPPGISLRYTIFGVLLVMASSCSVSQPPAQFTSQLAAGPVRGFQIQIHSTQDKASAQKVMQTAESWCAMEKPAQRALFGIGYLPVEIKWLDPYYRVRIGHFRSREEARSVLAEVARKFPAALVVPYTIL